MNKVMKSTYKLLGVLWDHRDLPRKLPDFSQPFPVSNYHEEYNLFDIEVYMRRISVSEMMQIEKPEEIADIVI